MNKPTEALKERFADISRSMITTSHYGLLDDKAFNDYLNSFLQACADAGMAFKTELEDK